MRIAGLRPDRPDQTTARTVLPQTTDSKAVRAKPLKAIGSDLRPVGLQPNAPDTALPNTQPREDFELGAFDVNFQELRRVELVGSHEIMN